MSIRGCVRVSSVLILFGTLSSLHAEPSTKDWIRGTGKNLQIRLSGEVFHSDGQPASDILVSGGINASGVSQPLEPTIDGNRFELWIQ